MNKNAKASIKNLEIQVGGLLVTSEITKKMKLAKSLVSVKK